MKNYKKSEQEECSFIKMDHGYLQQLYNHDELFNLSYKINSIPFDFTLFKSITECNVEVMRILILGN